MRAPKYVLEIIWNFAFIRCSKEKKNYLFELSSLYPDLHCTGIKFRFSQALSANKTHSQPIDVAVVAVADGDDGGARPCWKHVPKYLHAMSLFPLPSYLEPYFPETVVTAENRASK